MNQNNADFQVFLNSIRGGAKAFTEGQK